MVLTLYFIPIGRKPGSSVSIPNGYALDDPKAKVLVPVESRIFTSPQRPERLWDPLSLLSYSIGGSFPGVKLPGSEADHSPPTIANVKKMRIYTSTPHTYS
jgi:hypothetical protein